LEEGMTQQPIVERGEERSSAIRHAPTGKVSFKTGGAFLRDTRAEVEEHLAVGHVRLRAAVALYAKAPLAVGLIALSWAALLFVRPGAAGVALCIAGLAVGAILVAFCVQHDANHGSYFKSRRYNHLLGWTSDALLGFSSYVWRVKHNVAHHTYTNVVGYDDDIEQAPLARFAPTQTPRPWHRFQHLYVWPLYSLMGIRWQTVGDLESLRRGSFGKTALRFPSGWAWAGLLGGKAFFIAWAVVAPLLVYPWWAVAATYLGLTMLMSIVMATTFQLAHCVEEATFTPAADLSTGTRLWAVHEVETTVNFCPRNKLLTWALGGLNYQIEHHLFPRLPHTLYPVIAPIVERNCRRHGVRYTAQPSLRLALRSHFRHLRGLGRAGLRAELELG
jgi:linoleoyl-CoA desaturase